MVLVTIMAIAVMLATNGGFNKKQKPAKEEQSDSTLLASAAPVEVARFSPETIEIIDTYSGMIRPEDRYSLGFEVGGQVETLAKDEGGKPLDVGDRVYKSMPLAWLDQRIMQARKREADAKLTLAKDNLQRAVELRRKVRSSVSESEVSRLQSEVAVATAQADVAEQQIADAVLICPVDGVVARRMVEVGESVAANEALFEVVTVDKVTLVVGVPESRLPDVDRRFQQVQQMHQERRRLESIGRTIPASMQFVAHVRLIGTNRFGEAWPDRTGEVIRVAETADDRTGLFEVEILLDNADRMLRPGYIAIADLVIDVEEGYRLPISGIVFRDRKASFYCVSAATTANEASTSAVMEPSAGNSDEEVPGQVQPTSHIATRHTATKYIEQDGYLVIPTRLANAVIKPPLPWERGQVVTKGHQRLIDGRRVQIVAVRDDDAAADVPTPDYDFPAVGSRR